MKVAIVGGTGSFGRALAKKLRRLDHEVYVGSRAAQRGRERAIELGVQGGANGELARARGDDRGDPEREPRVRRHGGSPSDRPAVISIVPVEGLPEIKEGDDLAALIAERAELQGGDVLVVAQKAVSKAEGRVVRLVDVEPSDEARRLAAGEEPRRLGGILGALNR